jgi:uncharacterized protein (DUF2164 family)
MARVDETLSAEVKRLVEEGAAILRKVQSLSSEIAGEELAEVTSWVTRLGQLIRRIYGEKSQQFATYSKALETENFYYLHSNWNAHIAQVLGVAKSLAHDLEHGLLFDIRTLVQADVFSDFLEMGEYLLNEGYKDAAAVIIGAVLEDGLRKVAEKRSVSTVNPSGRPLTIDPLNAALVADDAYTKLVQKQITTWAHVRNKAAHGEYSEYTKDQVQMMLMFVQGFFADHLK